MSKQTAAGKTAAGKTAAAEGPELSHDAGEPELSYEEAREELATVVRTLESGGLSLKDSLALWERGEKLATTCEQWLEGARAKLAAAMSENEDTTSTGETDATPF